MIKKLEDHQIKVASIENRLQHEIEIVESELEYHKSIKKEFNKLNLGNRRAHGNLTHKGITKPIMSGETYESYLEKLEDELDNLKNNALNKIKDYEKDLIKEFENIIKSKEI